LQRTPVYLRAPALIVLLPLLVALPQIVGLLDPDPLLRSGFLTLHISRAITDGGFARGVPYLDPNDGYTTQALGRLAALDWLHGVVPWWNPYSGVGLPLAAEFQPAAFFPLILVHLLPNAMLWQHLALQIIAGWGAYALLRQLRLSEPAATAGGVLFAFNGTIAWFNHAAALPVPFLPWMLVGIERVHGGGSWRVFAMALALSLLAGFPETAYINGLLALAWAAMRCVQTPARQRLSYMRGIALGGCAGLGLSAPQLLAFFEFLPHSDLGGHAGALASASMPLPSLIPSLIAPYAFGPPMAYTGVRPSLLFNWANLGGYVGLPVLGMAVFGLLSRRRGFLPWMLAAWTMLALAKTFGMPPVAQGWNLIPGIAASAFFRYAQPSWELALIILAALGLDSLEYPTFRPARTIAAVIAGVMLLSAAVYIGWADAHLPTSPGLRIWGAVSLLWAAAATAATLVLVSRGGSARAIRAASALLMCDAAVMALIPSLSLFASARLDMPAIRFLQENLGRQRFFTLGPIQPNYGAYFGIASINHNYLPVARRWTDWVRVNLDRAADPVVFNGNFGRLPGQPSQADELRQNLPAYGWAGVKYVVAPVGTDPLGAAATGAASPHRVYTDRLLSIYELPGARPYFEIQSGDCTLASATSRTRAAANCRTGGTLLRRELFLPGWSATLNGAPAAIHAYKDLFQAVDLPAGETTIAFTYAPPHILWAWLALLVAGGSLILPAAHRRRATVARNAGSRSAASSASCS
jgi:hypothetical protein